MGRNKSTARQKETVRGDQEEDLDKILAELGEALPRVDVPNALDNVRDLEEGACRGDNEEEHVESSVASKKNRKKKEKAKEKKAAAVASALEEKPDEEETKKEMTKGSKVVPVKKVRKLVREIHERNAKTKEAEERKKREEEERIRIEDEERRRQEEEERKKDEEKRLKKEKEKEKRLKKKQEGKPITKKQKEEARKSEAFRKHLMVHAEEPLPSGTAPSRKWTIYSNKKTSKPQTGPDSGAATTLHSVKSKDSSKEIQHEIEAQEEVGSLLITTEEEDDDDEWDRESSDKEEVDSEPEPEPLLNKEIKSAKTASQDVVLPSTTTKSVGLSENLEVEKKDSQVEVTDKKNNKVPVIVKEETSKLGDSGQNLRSPICCIMGHVDTGKTKLLDCIRGTNVQEGEAGGITQQIGATYFPAENIRERTKELKADCKLNVPGLLVIDTPGHESFTNLRSRGSGLCDIAVLVVDIMHGLEPQTIESLNLLKMRNTDFIIALNKVDRLYGWKTCRNAPISKAIRQQSNNVQMEFNSRLTQVVTQFKEQGLNTELYYKNKEMGETINIVPTSAISGEGIPDLLLLLVKWTEKTMIERLTYSNEMQCTVLEVKVVEGHGTTIDVVLVNGVLHEGDRIVVCGLQGPIVTSIRALLTPHPMKELRVKGTYLHHKEIKAAQGIKITAHGLEHAIAGTSLYVVGPTDELNDVKKTAMEDMKSIMNRIDTSGEGVYVQASTLGSLEALLEFLKSPGVQIPVSGIDIGPVHKRSVMKASVMLEKKREYGTILAFDVKVTQEARELADELGVKIFTADIIYHLFDQFKAYIGNIKEERKKEAAEVAVFPCVLKIMPNCVFNTKDPIILGVEVLKGIAKIGTPICVPTRDFIELGRIASIEHNKKPVDYAKKGQEVAIKIIGSNSDEQQKTFGRHFGMENRLVSKISRNSIDALEEHFVGDLSVEDEELLSKLKILFKVP